MTKYLVRAQYTVNLYTHIEADSIEDAWNIARDLDGGEFVEEDQGAGSDWVVYDVCEEVT